MKSFDWPIFLKFFLFIIIIFSIPSSGTEQTRALWITRWDYSSREDIEKIIDNADQLHFNVLLFQIRGNATVFYSSQYEPWADEIGGKDPEWDPLQYAIELAHHKGIELHAWINVYPAWRGSRKPGNQNQLYFQQPRWFMYDIYGRPQKLNSGYVWLSPTHPEVSDYLLKICREIYQKYNIDGLHLDYIRYPGIGYSYDPTSVAIFEQKFGQKPKDLPQVWTLWRRNAITTFIDSLYCELKREKPNVSLSASVIADYERGNQIFLQDSHGWLARGIIDIIYPMIYTSDDSLFKRELQQHLDNHHNRHVYPGINIEYANAQSQLNIAQKLNVQGIAFFSYGLVTNNHKIKPQFNFLPNSVWVEKTLPASLEWKKYIYDNQGPVITQVKTIPSVIIPDIQFKIAAKITDPSGVYDGMDGQGVYLLYDRTWPPVDSNKISMKRIKKTQNWFLTEETISPQRVGLDFRCRIFAHDDYHESADFPKRNLGYSDVWSLSILKPNESYVSKGEFGPVLWNPNALVVTEQGHIWANTTENGLIVIFNDQGEPTSFSPIEMGVGENNQVMELDKIAGFTIVQENTVIAACNTNPPTLFKFDSQSGKPLLGIRLDYKVGEIASDKNGHLFVLEENSTQWHVLNPEGKELKGSPFGGGKTGVDIAVLENAAMVFITERTSQTLECWHGAIEGKRAQYWKSQNFPANDLGLGKVTVDSYDHVYISHSQRGVISIFDRVGKPLEHLIGGDPPLYSPRQVVLTKDRKTMYVLEVCGVGPTKLLKWVKKLENPAIEQAYKK